MKDLFIGDSHSIGYSATDEKIIEWDDNNYAEIWHKNTNIPVIICASPGVGNYKYAEWVKCLVDKHPDISRIFLQSTYWNRFRICANQNLDFGFADYTLDSLLGPAEVDPKLPGENILRYSDLKIKDKFVEMQLKPAIHIYERFKGFRIDTKLEENPSDIEALKEEYMYTKVWYELQTQLQYIQYCKDMFIIDKICKEHNIQCFLWRINDRCHFPESFDMFGSLDTIKIVVKSAENYITEKFDIDAKSQTIDYEHYNKTIHTLIAENFIPWVING